MGLFCAQIWQDIQFGVRTLTKQALFTITGVLTLSLGIGSSMTMFSVIEGPLLNRPPIRNLDRIVNVWMVDRQTGRDRELLSIPDFYDLRSRADSFQQLAAYRGSTKVLTGRGEPQLINGLEVSANFFQLLGVKPKLGRIFAEGEDQLASGQIAIISERMWRADLMAKQEVIGQIVHLGDAPYTIVGVMPSKYWFDSLEIDFWTPLTIDPTTDRTKKKVKVVGRLQNGVSAERADAEMVVLGHGLASQFSSSDQKMGLRAVSYEAEFENKNRFSILFGLGPSFFVLLIGCGNIASLLLARGFARQTELATRAALGARRHRIIQQLLTEHFLLAIAGGVGGIGTACVGIAALRYAFQTVQPYLAESVHLDWKVLAYGVTATLVIPSAFAIVPSIRVSKANLNDVLRQGGQANGARISLKRLPFVVLEVAMAMVLLIVSGLMLRTMTSIERNTSPRIHASKIVSFTVSKVDGVPERSQLMTALSVVPDLAAIGSTTSLPLLTGRRNEQVLEFGYDSDYSRIPAIQMDVDAGFFRVLELTVLKGRLPFNSETSATVVSETFARQSGREVVGLKVHREKQPDSLVVGVVRDWLFDDKSGEPLPTVYFPISKSSSTLQIVARSDVGASIIPDLRRIVRSWNPDEPLEDCQTIDKSIKDELAGSQMVMRMIITFALIALLIASIGVYGVMDYSITRRTHEMGIRLALGATPARVFTLVLREAMLLLAVGTAVGWLLGVAVGHIIAHELIVTPADPLIATSCAVVLLAAGLAASYVPARRAARGDPIVALRFQ